MSSFPTKKLDNRVALAHGTWAVASIGEHRKPMKVFWSWQSDTPGKTGRFFVRDALKVAIDELQAETDVLEPSEREVRGALHLDHDRKDRRGSPDLANTILEKIKAVTVVVADVTTVGIVPPEVSSEDGQPKKLINSNVGIELGYALDALTDQALLMVMNTHYGDRDDLPFDLRHKAGPILFNLAPNATKIEIATAATKLKTELVTALRPYLALAAKQVHARTPFPAMTPATTGPATFFPSGAVLATAGDPGEQEFRFDHDKLIYLRLFPVGGAPVTRAKVAAAFRAKKVSILSSATIIGGTYGRNEWGSILFDYGGATHIHGLTQGFETGELWGVNGVMFQPQKTKHHRTGAEETIFALPIITVEKVFARTLRNYVRVMAELDLKPPFTVVMGLTGLRDAYITMPGGPTGRGDWAGPVLRDAFQQTAQIATTEPADIDAVLRNFFNAVYDLAERDRREVLTDSLVRGHELVSP